MISRRRLTALLSSAAIAATALVCAPAASAAPGDRELVDAWYADFLGRDADAGSQYWVDRLAVQAPADVVWSITHSEEYDAATVDLYYGALLDREPDAGARFWIDGINDQRFPSEWALQNILASPEYRSGKTRTTIVDGWYEAVLGRAPRAGEVAYWSERINVVGSLIAVRELYYTDEAVTLRITDSYDLLLDRAPTRGEVTYWFPFELENSVNVDVLIAATPEYRSLTS